MPRHSIVSAQRGKRGNTNDLSGMLTHREQQVAALVCDGFTNKMIARKLDVVEGTVKAHLHAIYGKLGVQSRIELLDALAGSSPIGAARL